MLACICTNPKSVTETSAPAIATIVPNDSWLKTKGIEKKVRMKMPIDPSSYGPDVWELYEQQYEEIQNYYEEEEYYEEVALQRVG